RIWLFKDHLPLLPNGKVNRQALRAHAETEAAGPAASDIEGEGLSTAEIALIESWTGVFARPGINLATTFISLGGDSLSYVSAYLATEEVLGAVPDGWTEMTIAELAAARVERNRFWSKVDSTMLIRAVSISFIVAYHFALSSIGNGFTGAFFVISGYLFGGIQLQEVFKGKSSAPILNSMKNIFIPTMVFTLIESAGVMLHGKAPPLNQLIMTADLVDYLKIEAQHIPLVGHEVSLWYVHALLKILLILYVATSLLPKAFKLMDRRFEFSLAMFGLGCIGRFLIPALIQPDILSHSVPELSTFQLAFTSNLATFMLGAVIANAPKGGTKGWLLALVAGYALLSGNFYGLTNGLTIAAAGFIMLTATRVTLPRPLAGLVITLSGASLYIYLSQFIFGLGVRALHGSNWPLMQTIAAMVGGVAVYMLWTSSVKLFGKVVTGRLAVPWLTRS
ncbi:MAG: hypothetical protein P4L64_14690, partial [Caulobacteraceae bacterium]|nr:hypothetical protein [Caulobacteraceae bacterium]